MIRHVVLCRFREEVGTDERAALFDRLCALCDELPNILGAGFGPNLSEEGFSRGFDGGFTIDFVDESARDAYLEDDTHRAIGADLVASLEGGSDGLIVFDLAL